MMYNSIATAGFSELTCNLIATRGYGAFEYVIPIWIDLISDVSLIIDLESDVGNYIELVDYVGPTEIIELNDTTDYSR